MTLSMNSSTDFKSIRNEVALHERQARRDLAACDRLVDRYNPDTARVCGTKGLQ
jgi:hypothetical protein